MGSGGMIVMDEDTCMVDVARYFIEFLTDESCRKQCPADAIDGDKKLIHIIDQDKCTRCGTCFEVCPPKFSSVVKLSGEPVPDPVPEEERTIRKKTKEKG